MEEITLQELFFILRKWYKLIIAITIIAISLAGAISHFVLKPEYRTFTTMMIGESRESRLHNTIEYEDLVLNQRLVATYVELLKSRAVTDRVIDNLNLDISYSGLRNKVNADLVKNTEIIKVEVTDSDPNMAAKIANVTADIFVDTIRDIMGVDNVRIIDRAQIPINPVSPNIKLNIAIAGVLGLMLAIFLAFLFEFLDDTIRSATDIENHLKLSVIGTIPIIDKYESQLISITNPKSPISEAFRTLRTNIKFSAIDKEIKTIVVTSSVPEEGKSLVSNNLAWVIAQANLRVLLVDCDLRKPKVHRNFKLSNNQGLTNILIGEKNLFEVVNRYESLTNLHILTSGPIPPNPSEIIGSNRMKEFLKMAREDYDIVILDSSPIGLVTDSAVLSTISDALIYVTAIGQTKIDMAKSAKELLDLVDANVIGAVLNKIPVDGRSYYQYSSTLFDKYYRIEEDRSKRRRRSDRA
jgi:capsular exopolysaccharide synthesis family protein